VFIQCDYTTVDINRDDAELDEGSAAALTLPFDQQIAHE
jgi:hypothetical protein